uniref:Savignygrin-like protein n=1 Tax=Ornithodoros coriaceus TaxID=92741 RepID=B2D2C3_ORNCO|nr:savignygrin-like protein [Ornithodoros coriaceus]
MQSKVLLFAVLLLVSAVLAHGADSPCYDQPVWGCRGDAPTKDAWTYFPGDGCTEVSYCASYEPTTTNRFSSEGECKKACP